MSETVTAPAEFTTLSARFGDGVLGWKTTFGSHYIYVKREIVPAVLETLRDDPALSYDYFSECLGVDYSAWDGPRDLSERFEVVYNLMSTKTFSRIFIKVGVDDGQSIPSCKAVFLGAEYPEREINDLFGIQFEGETYPGRFLLPDDWVGHPLRKEFPLGGEDVLFDKGFRGPAVEDLQRPHTGESFEGKTSSEDVGGR